MSNLVDAMREWLAQRRATIKPFAIGIRRVADCGEAQGSAIHADMTSDRPTVQIDTDRIDDATLALLLLGLHDHSRVWKSFDWQTMERLHAKGMISDPVGKAKSVVLTPEGLDTARSTFERMFGKSTG